jgi:hypothetical protein
VVKIFARNPEFQFFHFGVHDTGSKRMQFRRVSVIEDGKNAMTDALVRERIDVVILWSIWPETFCFTAHEAVAAGAMLVACSKSGNVTQLIKDTREGLIFSGDAALTEAFGDGTIAKAVRARRGKLTAAWQTTDSHMTADIIRLNGQGRRHI